jgi:hypothetical protein
MYEFVAFSAIVPGLVYGLEDPEIIFQNWLYLNTPGNFSKIMQDALVILRNQRP